MWASQTPLRQFKGVPGEILAKVGRGGVGWGGEGWGRVGWGGVVRGLEAPALTQVEGLPGWQPRLEPRGGLAAQLTLTLVPPPT